MYVVKNKRLREYLYNLGFDFTRKPDIKGNLDEIYLFKKTDLLMEAISFYSKVKKIQKQNK